MIPYDVTDSPPAWSLTGRPKGHGRQFYIDADVTGGWPYQAEETLCKFGVTAKGPQIRCAQNQKNLRSPRFPSANGGSFGSGRSGSAGPSR